jgi:hypothetical protein
LILQKTLTVTEDNTISALDKIKKSLALYFEFANGREELVEHIHQKSFEAMHQRMEEKMMQKIIPLFSSIIEEGMQVGLFKLEDPEVTTEIVMTGLGNFLNRMIRECWGKPEFFDRVRQAMGVMERALGAAKGSLQLFAEGEIDE